MKVQIGYSIEADDVFKECAKIIGLHASVLQSSIDIFTGVQTELTATEQPVNVAKVHEMVKEFREALVSLDVRMAEVGVIVSTYTAHRDAERLAAENAELEAVEEGSPEVSEE